MTASTNSVAGVLKVASWSDVTFVTMPSAGHASSLILAGMNLQPPLVCSGLLLCSVWSHMALEWHPVALRWSFIKSSSLLNITYSYQYQNVILFPLFGQVARLPGDVPVHKALNLPSQPITSQPPSSQWHCCPGYPCNRCVDHPTCRSLEANC